MARRPEHAAPPEIVSEIVAAWHELLYNLKLYFQFYNDDEAKKYSTK